MMNNKTGECFYHVIRDGALRMTVRGSELKSTDIVESVDEPDSLYKLEVDIDRWLDKWPGLSVRVADIKTEIMEWLDRRAAIAESECAWRWQSIADARDRAELERDDAFELIHDLQEQVDDLTIDSKACLTMGRMAVLEAENDSLAKDLDECMEERGYWKQQVQRCMDAAYPPSHSPERPYDPRVMVYPTPDECTTPSTLVSEIIDGLRDDIRDTVMPIVEESANTKADCERWRNACGSMMDAAHEIERIMAEMELK